MMCIVPSHEAMIVKASPHVDSMKHYHQCNTFHSYSNKKPHVFCANCGGYGHVYKTCNHPVISYGVICYKTYYDPETNSIHPKYLMVQRRDSLSYVEFIRGKYSLNNREYLMQLFTNMTPDERNKLGQLAFEEIWSEMWSKPLSEVQSAVTQNANFNREWKDAAEKFNTLKTGYYIETKEGCKIFFDIKWLLENTFPQYAETEWGFPKGRRNINEDDVSCAVREFKEETGIHASRIRLLKDMKPIEEVFVGSNKVRYKHVYYVAKYTQIHMRRDGSLVDCSSFFDPNNTQQTKEVRDVKWFTYQEAQDKIRDMNVERKELFKRLNQVLIKSMVHR